MIAFNNWFLISLRKVKSIGEKVAHWGSKLFKHPPFIIGIGAVWPYATD
jgi:hypothetical protein